MRTGKTIPNLRFPQGNSETTQNMILSQLSDMLNAFTRVFEDVNLSSLCFFFFNSEICLF